MGFTTLKKLSFNVFLMITVLLKLICYVHQLILLFNTKCNNTGKVSSVFAAQRKG